MKLFACQGCEQILFFESVTCTRCGRALAYLQDREMVSAIEPARPPAPPGAGPSPRPPERWQALARTPKGAASYKLCRNYTEHAVCNWALPSDEGSDYCLACRLNRVIPNLSVEGAKAAWHRLEIAKRRVVYTLLQLGLPVEPKHEVGAEDGPPGLAFDFLRDGEGPDAPKVFTGHDHGVITINIAEADDPFREQMRVQMGEAYRTVLGHFRHEIGHYYWDRLIGERPILEVFRDLFGDERADYAEARERHYKSGPPADWPVRFVSAYASMHPWEDWAETWSHYLHIVDTLETARAHGLSLQPAAVANPKREKPVTTRRLDPSSFDDLIAGWIPLTMALNSLNRSMGMSDGYPFVLSDQAIAKLRFVHELVGRQAS